MQLIVKEAIKRFLLAPFSNKVTRILLCIGGSLLLIPTAEYILMDLLVQHFLGMSVGFEYPSTMSFVAGVFVLLTASIQILLPYASVSLIHQHSEVEAVERG